MKLNGMLEKHDIRNVSKLQQGTKWKKTEITPCLISNDDTIATGILEDMNCH